jgi:xylan 1,4-beta-xylosidase
VNLQFDSLAGNHSATLYRLDADHGSPTKAYVAMGSPAFPTPAQIKSLKEAAQLPAPESITIHDGRLALHLAPKALVVLEIR